MRTARIGTAAVVGALLIGAAPAATAGGDRVFGIEDCGKAGVRPDGIVLTCADFGLYINGLDWKSWGERKARATGVIHAKNCDPSCAEGFYEDFPV